MNFWTGLIVGIVLTVVAFGFISDWLRGTPVSGDEL